MCEIDLWHNELYFCLVAPVFNLTDVFIQIPEDTSGVFDVWTLTSTDLDGDTVKLYEIVSQSEADVFRINVENSKIVTNTSTLFDYETTTSYTITLR